MTADLPDGRPTGSQDPNRIKNLCAVLKIRFEEEKSSTGCALIDVTKTALKKVAIGIGNSWVASGRGESKSYGATKGIASTFHRPSLLRQDFQ
jgi:hypothetical protein